MNRKHLQLIYWAIGSFVYFKIALDAAFYRDVTIIGALLFSGLTAGVVYVAPIIYLKKSFKFHNKIESRWDNLSVLLRFVPSWFGICIANSIAAKFILFGFSKRLNRVLGDGLFFDIDRWEKAVLFLLIISVPVLLHLIMFVIDGAGHKSGAFGNRPNSDSISHGNSATQSVEKDDPPIPAPIKYATIQYSLSDQQLKRPNPDQREVERVSFLGLVKLARTRATSQDEHEDFKGRLLGYYHSRHPENVFNWIHIEFESSYDGGILILRYFFPAGDFADANEDEMQKKLLENMYLHQFVSEMGMRNLGRFWHIETNEWVFELRYALSSEIDQISLTEIVESYLEGGVGILRQPYWFRDAWFRIATDADNEDESKRFRLKRERFVSEGM